MIKRKIDRYLADFYSKNKKALLVTGARQTGKSFSIRQFGNTHFDNFVEINFHEHPEFVAMLSEAEGSNDIILRLSAFEVRMRFKRSPSAGEYSIVLPLNSLLVGR